MDVRFNSSSVGADNRTQDPASKPEEMPKQLKGYSEESKFEAAPKKKKVSFGTAAIKEYHAAGSGFAYGKPAEHKSDAVGPHVGTEYVLEEGMVHEYDNHENKGMPFYYNDNGKPALARFKLESVPKIKAGKAQNKVISVEIEEHLPASYDPKAVAGRALTNVSQQESNEVHAWHEQNDGKSLDFRKLPKNIVSGGILKNASKPPEKLSFLAKLFAPKSK
ncbi:MAG: hypothetical protein WCK42_06100 [Myxococcaceae bacterium]